MGNSSYKKRADWVVITLYALLVVFGWLSIYAANFSPEHPVFFDTSKEYFKQLVWIILSLVFIGLILLTDSKFFVEFAYVFFGLTIFLLLAVLLMGTVVNGAKSWFEVGPIRFQPAELSKVATNLALARVMSRFGFNFSFKNKVDFFKATGIVFLPLALILLQNDTGSALVYFTFILVFYRQGLSPYVLVFGLVAGIVVTLTLMADNSTIIALTLAATVVVLLLQGVRKELYVAGAIGLGFFLLAFGVIKGLGINLKVEYILTIGVALFTIALFIYSLSKRIPKIVPTYLFIMWSAILLTFSADYFFEKVLSPYQLTRINVLFGLEEDPLGAGYNVKQSMIAIGSGGAMGKGFLQGTQTKLNFVPEQSTDFIFCTVGEEWGFLGSMIVITLFVALILRLLYLAEQQHSVFSRVYGYGVACIFFFHFAINMGMTIGLAPVIGIPLPFFSYGGSSLWGFTMLLFVFVKLDINRNELIR